LSTSKLLRLSASRLRVISGLAILATLIASQSLQPESAALANTATISDTTSNCQASVTSPSLTIDSTSTSISLVGTRCVVQFLAVGSYSITIPSGISAVDYLVVGGGGGGASGGGGGGGVLQAANFAVTSGNSYSVSVGAGGQGGSGGNAVTPVNATNGGQSTFATATALGGGAGGAGNQTAANGSSGGGARYDCTNANTCIGYGTLGQGTNGAPATAGSYGGGGGGGGAGSAGGNSLLSHIGGKGGDGKISSITGVSTYYGGGGGGGINSNDTRYGGLSWNGSVATYILSSTPITSGGGAGGLGGGGRGSSYGYTSSSGTRGDISVGGHANGTAGTANTGGGGGGVDPEDAYAYAGGSGIVILSYVAATYMRTVTFDSNNGSGNTSTQSVQSGVPTQLVTNPYLNSGYVFQGWNTAANGTGTSYVNMANINTAAAMTLYAQWLPGVNHTVTFNSNTGTGTQPQQVAGLATNLNANQFSKTGYTFMGWTTNANGTGFAFADLAVFSFGQDLTLYAKWTPTAATHMVTFYSNSATGGSTNAQVANSSQPLNLNGYTKSGSSFLGWNTVYSASTATYLDGQVYSFTSDLVLYPIWVTSSSHTVAFMPNQGSGTMSAQSASSSTVLSANSFTRTGYTFLNWNTAADGSGASYGSSYNYSFAANMTLYAIWGLNYSVSYDGNGSTGGAVPALQTSNVGGTGITLQVNTSALAKTGNVLLGWNTAANGSGTSYALGQINVAFAGDTTLYAMWSPANYVVFYSGNSSTSGSAPAFQIYTFGAAGLTIASNTGSLARTGYSFAGWNTAPDGTGTNYAAGASPITVAQDTVLFAKWTANQTTVSFVYNGSDGGDSTASANYATGNTALILPSPTKSGYAFGGWFSDVSLTTPVGAGGAAFTPSTTVSSTTLYALWTAQTYLVTYNYNGAGGGNGVASASFTTGNSAIVLPTPTRGGYNFDGWYSDSGFATNVGGAGASYYPTAANTSITLYAKWTAKTYTVTYDYAGADGGNSTVSDTYTSGGAAINLPAPTKTGYDFVSWSYLDVHRVIVISQGTATFSPNTSATAITLGANWNPGTYTLTYHYAGADGGNSTSTDSFTTGSASVALPSPTRSHYHFMGWFDSATAGNLVGVAGAVLAPTANRDLYAQWVQDSLFGLGQTTNLSHISVTGGLGSQYTATGNNNSVTVSLPGGALPDGTTLDVHLLNDLSGLSNQITGYFSFIVNVVVSWVASDGTVPSTAAGKPVVVTITNAAIKAGAEVYELIGGVPTLIGHATQDGSAQVTITDDPQIVIAATIADAPLNPVAVAGNGTAQVSWSAPVSTGGADITSYLVTASTGQTCTTTLLTCNFSSLPNGTALTFTVAAINAVGTSPSSSATLAVTPAAPPVAAAPQPTATPSPAPIAPTPSPTPTPKPKPTVKPQLSVTISGFAPGSSVLMPVTKKALNGLVSQFEIARSIALVGFTEGPTVLKIDRALSLARARVVAAYLKKLTAKNIRTTISSKQSLTVDDQIRSVQLTITF
jgi:uncharacterized repeat protein (TIGR02543 family)